MLIWLLFLKFLFLKLPISRHPISGLLILGHPVMRLPILGHPIMRLRILRLWLLSRQILRLQFWDFKFANFQFWDFQLWDYKFWDFDFWVVQFWDFNFQIFNHSLSIFRVLFWRVPILRHPISGLSSSRKKSLVDCVTGTWGLYYASLNSNYRKIVKIKSQTLSSTSRW